MQTKNKGALKFLPLIKNFIYCLDNETPKMMDKTEETAYWGAIWDKFKAGDRSAFECLYNEYIDALYAYGSRMTNHRALLEDAIQDLFINIYSYGTKLRNPQSLEFYLYKTLKRIIIRKLKDKYRFSHPDDFIEQFELRFPIEDFPDDVLDEHIIVLQKELRNLDSRQRELLYLRFTSGLKYKEIALLLDCSHEAVKKQVTRLLKRLQKNMNMQLFGLFALFYKK